MKPRVAVGILIISFTVPGFFGDGVSRAQTGTSEKLAVLPARGADLSSEASWQIQRYLSDYIVEKYSYLILDEASIRAHDRGEPIPDDSLALILKTLGTALQVDLVLLPELLEQDDGSVLRLLLFDVHQGRVRKVASKNCICLETNPQSFPFAEVTRLVFETPEIILTLDVPQETPELPPPPPAPVETPAPKEVKAPEEKTAPADTLVVEPTVPLPGVEYQKGSRWKRYAIGAAVLTGGLLYWVTKKSDAGQPAGRLPDPPRPPGN